MFTHNDIWRAIDRLAEISGYSASGLAKRAGLDPTTFNRSKRASTDGKPRWPSTESIAKILAATGATMSDFMSLVADDDHKGRAARAIPLIGFAQAGKAGFFDDAGYPAGTGWDEVQFPEYSNQVRNAHMYALQISGDSMEPVYRDGDIIVLAPGMDIRKGDRIVVRTKSGEVTAKEVKKQHQGRIELKALNPAHEDRAFALDDLAWMARIIWVSQ